MLSDKSLACVNASACKDLKKCSAAACSAPCFEPHSSNITCPCSYQVTLSIERAWQSCFQPISHRVSGLRQGDRTITVTSYDMVATTQIHVLGLDIYGYGTLPAAARSRRLIWP